MTSVSPTPKDTEAEEAEVDVRFVTQQAWDAAQAALQKRWPDMKPIDAALLSTYAVRAAAPIIAAAVLAASPAVTETEAWEPEQGWRIYTDALLSRLDRVQVLAAMWEQSAQPAAAKAGRILAEVLLSEHDCDGGSFDRTVCPDPCGAMHSYCSTCGARVDGCANDNTTRLAAVLPAPAVTAVPAKRTHATWGIDPSGYCNCDDCNAPVPADPNSED